MFLYKSAVNKHGSHNQQSHAGGRGSGRVNPFTGAPAAGGVNPYTNTSYKQEVSAAKADIDNRIKGAMSQKDRAPKGRDVKVHNARVDGTIRGFRGSKSALGNKDKMKELKDMATVGVRQSQSGLGFNDKAYEDYAFWQGFQDAVSQIDTAYGDIQR